MLIMILSPKKTDEDDHKPSGSTPDAGFAPIAAASTTAKKPTVAPMVGEHSHGGS